MPRLRIVDEAGDVLEQPSLMQASNQAVADFYAEHLDALQDLEGWLRMARGRLLHKLRMDGDIVTDHGTLTISNAGGVRLVKPARYETPVEP